MIRVRRTIRAGHPDIARICEQTEWVGEVVSVRYCMDDETGEMFKTVEIRPSGMWTNICPERRRTMEQVLKLKCGDYGGTIPPDVTARVIDMVSQGRAKYCLGGIDINSISLIVEGEETRDYILGSGSISISRK